MINRLITMMVSWGMFALLATPLALCESEAGSVESFDKYKVVTERNIFLRERPRPMRTDFVRPPTPSAPPVESGFTLTGVIRQGDEYIAFIEDTRKSVTSRVRIGETIADGRISRITLDGIVYEKDGTTADVGLGQRLSGGVAGIPAADSGSASGTSAVNPSETTAPSTPALSAGGDRSEILRRLREKRQMEMNKK